jgi:hypothetical protein
LDFIILSLTSESVAIIAKAFLSKISFTGYRGIIHAQIAKDGQLAFAAFDNFSQDTVWASVATIPAEFLDELTANGILNGYKRVN